MIIIIINSNQLAKAMNIVIKNSPVFKWQANIAVIYAMNKRVLYLKFDNI